VTKVTVRAPWKELLLASPLPVIGGWLIGSRHFALGLIFLGAGFVGLMVLIGRWRRQIAPEITSATERGKPRPFVDVAWPRWLVNAWVIFMASALVLLFIMLVALAVAKAT
jgi:hypothetical protein